MTARPALLESLDPAPGRPVSDRLAMGAVYTPVELARWAASLLGEVAAGPVRTVLDPAAGDGALLDAARAALPDVDGLVGLDLSEVAATSARTRLGSTGVRLEVRDALATAAADLPATDAVVMNPPWGSRLSTPTARLRALGYTLTAGQFDSWDLFVEWTVRSLPAGTPVVAILPDSVLLPEHTATRRLLLDHTQLGVVARLGEGWFEGVYRGVVVLAYTTGRPTAEPVRAVRIDHAARRRVLRAESALADEAERAGRLVDPAAWVADPDAGFRITEAAFSSAWTDVLEAHGGPWTSWFHVGRGVEMGARGELFRCDACGWHRGPSRQVHGCQHCGRPTTWTTVQAITTRPAAGAVPLIVGRDVGRYAAAPSRWLRTGLPGVSYKDAALYREPKLLVRKTGLGLHAAVDRSGSHTNQVVFHYVPRADAPEWALHYVEGVLCSRVLLALHLSRTGETEWRSHPYVTPKVLATLPVPVPRDEGGQAQAIAAAVRGLHDAPPAERAAHEHRVDDLVAGLYGLDADGCAWVEQALAQTQALHAFAHLRAAPALRAVVA